MKLGDFIAQRTKKNILWMVTSGGYIRMLRLFVFIRFLHIHFHLNRSQNARHMIFSLIAVRVVVVVVSTSQCCKNFLNAKRKWNCILNATCRLNFYYISWGSSWSVNTHATKYKKKGLCVTIFFVRTIM